jgi:multiple sugar transport system permease protein
LVSRTTKLLFIGPGILYLAVIGLFPFFYSLYMSTTSMNLTRPRRSQFVGIDNYVQLLTDPLFQKAILNTGILAGASIALEIVIGFVIAKLFYEIAHLPTVNWLRTFFILPMMVTPVITGLMFTYMLNPTLGIANYLLSTVGLPGLAWFGSTQIALMSVIAVNVWQWTPFLMLIMLAGLMAVPREMHEAAALDGAHWYQVSWHIEIPSLRDVLLVGAIIRLIDNLRFFDVVYIATRGGPGDATEVISMFAYRQSFQFFNMGYGSAAAIVILFITLFVTTLAMRYLRRTDHA